MDNLIFTLAVMALASGYLFYIFWNSYRRKTNLKRYAKRFGFPFFRLSNKRFSSRINSRLNPQKDGITHQFNNIHDLIIIRPDKLIIFKANEVKNFNPYDNEKDDKHDRVVCMFNTPSKINAMFRILPDNKFEWIYPSTPPKESHNNNWPLRHLIDHCKVQHMSSVICVRHGMAFIYLEHRAAAYESTNQLNCLRCQAGHLKELLTKCDLIAEPIRLVTDQGLKVEWQLEETEEPFSIVK